MQRSPQRPRRVKWCKAPWQPWQIQQIWEHVICKLRIGLGAMRNESPLSANLFNNIREVSTDFSVRSFRSHFPNRRQGQASKPNITGRKRRTTD